MSLFDDLKKATDAAFGNETFWDVDFCRTDIPPIDYVLGGGFAFGRVAELFGNFSSGKTMILYAALIANANRGGISILNESEGAFNPTFYQRLGGDPDKLLVNRIDTVEQVFNCVKDICKTVEKNKKDAQPVVVGWDSLAATGTKHLMDTGMDKVDMSKARVIAQGFQFTSTLIEETRVAFIITNQTREGINTKDSATVTPGGRSTPFQASQRLELRYDGGSKTSKILAAEKLADVTSDDFQAEIGRWITAKCEKNKVGTPFRTCRLPIYAQADRQHPDFDYETKFGIDVDEALLDFYLHADFLLPDKRKVVQIPSQGWYCLHAAFDPQQEKFRYRDWPSIIGGAPLLRTLPYDYATLFPALVPPPPAPPEAPVIETQA